MQRRMLDDRPHPLPMPLMLSVCFPLYCPLLPPQLMALCLIFFVIPVLDINSPGRSLVFLASLHFVGPAQHNGGSSAESAYIPNRAKIPGLLISKGFSPFRFEKAREGPGFRIQHLIPPSLHYGMGSLKPPHFNHARSLEARARYFCYFFHSKI